MAFGRLFAQSRIFYVTQRQKGQLAEKALRIESVDAETGGWHSLFTGTTGGVVPVELPPSAAKLLSGAHAIASFVADGPDSAWVKNVRALNPQADVVPIAAHPPADFAGHHTEF